MEKEEQKSANDQARKKHQTYYKHFLNVLDAVGDYLHLLKLLNNAASGNYHCQKVCLRYDHIDDKGRRELEEKDNFRYYLLEQFNKASQSKGFLPMNDEGKRTLMRHLENADNRAYLRQHVRRLMEKDELVPANELVLRMLKAKKKRDERRAKKQAAPY